MGYRLHVRKINRIEYSLGAFNNMNDSIMPILSDFPGETWKSEDHTQVEIEKENFQKGIEKLEEMTEIQFREKYPAFPKDMTKSELTLNLHTLLAEADPVGNTVTLDWF